MYGRECVMPWKLDGDLGPLENEEDRDLPKGIHFSVILIDDPGHTLPKRMAHIPIHTPSSCDDDAFLPDLAETEPATPVPVHTERTLSAAEILADLSEGRGGVRMQRR